MAKIETWKNFLAHTANLIRSEVIPFMLPGVTHRDLKLENILLSEKNEPIVTDFGFARYIGAASDQRTRSRTFCGSYAYVAPEILQGNSMDKYQSSINPS